MSRAWGARISPRYVWPIFILPFPLLLEPGEKAGPLHILWPGGEGAGPQKLWMSPLGHNSSLATAAANWCANEKKNAFTALLSLGEVFFFCFWFNTGWRDSAQQKHWFIFRVYDVTIVAWVNLTKTWQRKYSRKNLIMRIELKSGDYHSRSLSQCYFYWVFNSAELGSRQS